MKPLISTLRRVSSHRIYRLINCLARSHVVWRDLDEEYCEMAAEWEREAEALEWAEAFISDVADEPR